MKGIDKGRILVRHQYHVGFVDRFPAGDGRTVEHNAVNEMIFRQILGEIGGVLPFSTRVGEAEIDELNVVIFNHSKNLGAHSDTSLLAGYNEGEWIAYSRAVRACNMENARQYAAKINVKLL